MSKPDRPVPVNAQAAEVLPRSTEIAATSARRGWALVIVAALGLALASWATNITSEAQLAGEADGFLTVRFTLSKLANAGTVWAGLGILCGWLVRRPLQAAAAGIAGSLFSLIAHYSLGLASGMFDATVWSENGYWFAAALIVGGPLGLVGAAARRSDLLGLAARLVVPLGAVLEPFMVNMLNVPRLFPQPERFSRVACGVTLLVAGFVSGAGVVVAVIRRRRLDPN